MKSIFFVPDSSQAASAAIRNALRGPLEALPKAEFIRAWRSVGYLFPGLHPDDYESEDSGWPRALRKFAAEAWRRAENGELEDHEIYPSAAQWSGLYDRMYSHTPEEQSLRLKYAAAAAA